MKLKSLDKHYTRTQVLKTDASHKERLLNVQKSLIYAKYCIALEVSSVVVVVEYKIPSGKNV